CLTERRERLNTSGRRENTERTEVPDVPDVFDQGCSIDPGSTGGGERDAAERRGSLRHDKVSGELWLNPHPDSTMTQTRRFARCACQAALRPVASAIASKGTTRPQPLGSNGLGPPVRFR